jgi:hypothetical protein
MRFRFYAVVNKSSAYRLSVPPIQHCLIKDSVQCAIAFVNSALTDSELLYLSSLAPELLK